MKNHNLGLTIPYMLDGEERGYHPDFVARVDDGRGAADPLNLLIEVSGEARRDKAAKVATARTMWVPAVNNQGASARGVSLKSGTQTTQLGRFVTRRLL